MTTNKWKHDPATWKITRDSRIHGCCGGCESPFVGLAVAITTPSRTSVICESCWILLLMDSPELMDLPVE